MSKFYPIVSTINKNLSLTSSFPTINPSEEPISVTTTVPSDSLCVDSSNLPSPILSEFKLKDLLSYPRYVTSDAPSQHPFNIVNNIPILH